MDQPAAFLGGRRKQTKRTKNMKLPNRILFLLLLLLLLLLLILHPSAGAGPSVSHLRPTIIFPADNTKLGYGQKLAVGFTMTRGGPVAKDLVSVTMVSPSYPSNSIPMNHGELVLESEGVRYVGENRYEVKVTTPGSSNLAPSGFYLLFVRYQEIPSEGLDVMIG